MFQFGTFENARLKKILHIDKANIAAAATVEQQGSFVQLKSESTFVLIVKNVIHAMQVPLH